MAKTLVKRYSGRGASSYDGKRASSARWSNEIAAFERLLDVARPRAVLDCPFGTGRWIPQYDARDIGVFACDISEAMLAEARKKIAPERAAKYDVVAASVFDFDFGGLAAKPDVTACVRFVNWVSYDQAVVALERLGRAGSPAMILGASVIPEGAGLARRIVMQGALRALNFGKRSQPPQFVHPEGRLLQDLRGLGWTVRERSFIFANASRENYFYLLSR